MSPAKSPSGGNVIPFRPRAAAVQPVQAPAQPCIDIHAWYHAEAVQAKAPAKRDLG